MIPRRASTCLALGITLAALASLRVAAYEPEHNSVKRGDVERQGRAWVERWECSVPVREGGRLVLRADSGSIAVRPEATHQMECQMVLRAYIRDESEARRYFERYELSVHTMEGGSVYVTAKFSGGRWHSAPVTAEFSVRVPERFNLDIETQGGDISIEHPLQGEVRATTAGGDIHTSDVSAAARLESAGGNITLGNIGGRLEARTAGGGIRAGNVRGDTTLESSGGEIVAGQVNGTVRAETAGGDVIITSAAGAVTAQTAGGQIRIGPAGGSVRAQTAGGSVQLQGARGRVVVETAGGSINLYDCQGAVKASTASGHILAQIAGGEKKAFGASALETSMGDVQVYLPPNVALTIDAAIEMAGGHRIVSDFPLDIQGSQEQFFQRQIRGHGLLNGGGEVLRIRTVNGNIEIHKVDSQTLEKLRAQQEAEWNRCETLRTQKEERRQQRDEGRSRRKKSVPD